MHWELWDTDSGNLVEDFATEAEGLQAVREILAVNRPDYVDFLVLGAMYDEGESRDEELPPVLRGAELQSRLAETEQAAAVEAARTVHERIRTWLAAEGWAFKEVTDSSLALNLAVTFGGEQTVHIVQRHNRVHLAVIRDIALGEDLRSILTNLPDQTKVNIQSDLFRDLCLIGVEFEGVDLEINTIRCFARAYFDGLSQEVLMQKMLLVHRATSLIRSTLHRALQEYGLPSQTVATLLHLVSPDRSHLTLVS